jgi:hypothetical protein
VRKVFRLKFERRKITIFFSCLFFGVLIFLYFYVIFIFAFAYSTINTIFFNSYHIYIRNPNYWNLRKNNKKAGQGTYCTLIGYSLESTSGLFCMFFYTLHFHLSYFFLPLISFFTSLHCHLIFPFLSTPLSLPVSFSAVFFSHLCELKSVHCHLPLFSTHATKLK